MSFDRIWIRVGGHTYYPYADESAVQFVDRVQEEAGYPAMFITNNVSIGDIFIAKGCGVGIEEAKNIIDNGGVDYWEDKDTVYRVDISEGDTKEQVAEKVKVLLTNQSDPSKNGIAMMSRSFSDPGLFGYPGYDKDEDQEEEIIEEDDKPLDEEFIRIKEISKIKLDPGEALIIKLPPETNYEDAQRTYEYVVQVLKTDQVLIFIGNVEFSKVDFSSHAPTKKHPLYE